jgi:hypothetical protein
VNERQQIEIEVRLRSGIDESQAVEKLRSGGFEVSGLLRRPKHVTLILKYGAVVDEDLRISVSDDACRRIELLIEDSALFDVKFSEFLIVVRKEWDRADVTIASKLLHLCCRAGCDLRVYRYT